VRVGTRPFADEFDGTEPLILIGGEWLHPICAEHMAREVTPAPEWEPEPRPVPTWIYLPALKNHRLFNQFNAHNGIWLEAEVPEEPKPTVRNRSRPSSPD
jgi:hypothetical protein